MFTQTELDTLRASTVSHTDGTAQHKGHVRAPTFNALFAYVLHLPTQTSDSCAGPCLPFRETIILPRLTLGCNKRRTLRVLVVQTFVCGDTATVMAACLRSRSSQSIGCAAAHPPSSPPLRPRPGHTRLESACSARCVCVHVQKQRDGYTLV
jgi:hypothetical protein